MKALSADVRDFFQNHWPKGYYHDECGPEWEVDLDKSWPFEETEMIDLETAGVLVPEEGDGDPISFESAFKKWKKNRDFERIIIEVPKARLDSTLATLKELQLKVVKS